jgi:hypothetical protein
MLGFLIAYSYVVDLGLPGKSSPDSVSMVSTVFLFVLLPVLIMLFVDSGRRSRMQYGVTDRRILILGEPQAGLKSLPLGDAAAVRLSERSGAEGTITFTDSKLALELIDDVERVHGLLQEAQRAGSARGGTPSLPPSPEAALSTEARLQRHLGEGERLLWSGRPGQGLRLTRQSGLMLALAAFQLPWAVRAWKRPIDNFDLYMALIPLSLALLGLLTIVADRRLQRRTHYGVTDRRILILREPGRSWLDRFASPEQQAGLTSLALRELDDVDLRLRRNGSGSIAFGRRAPRLERIEHAERVAGLIEEARKGAQA